MIDYYEIVDALASDYLNVFLVELENNSAYTVKLEGYETRGIKQKPMGFCYSEMLKTYANDRVYFEDRQFFLDSLLADGLRNYFSEENRKLEISYRILENEEIHYYSAHYICVTIKEDIVHLIASFRNIDNIVMRQNEKRREGLYSAYSALANIYLSMHRVNLKENTYTEIKASKGVLRNYVPNSDKYDENVRNIFQNLAEESSIESVLRFVEPKTLDRRMKKKDHIFTDFLSNESGRCRIHFLKEDEDENGNLWHVILAVEQLQKENENPLFKAMARDFQNVYWVNLNDGTARTLKLEDPYTEAEVRKKGSRVFYYRPFLKHWMMQNVHPEDRERLVQTFSPDHLRQIFSEKNEYSGSYRILIDGQIHNYQFDLTRIDEKGYVVAGIRNIDAVIEEHLAKEARQREIELEYQKKLIETANEAERANVAKTEFLQRMSHDIRTPINGIRGMIEIAEHYNDDIAKQMECREKVKAASELLLELVNEILEMNKLETGEIVLDRSSFDITDIEKSIYAVIARQAESRGITIRQTKCEIPYHRLIGCASYFKRILLNILSNAIKYNKDGGKIDIVCTQQPEDENKLWLTFSCADTGIGMSEQFQNHLFEPFMQEKANVRTTYMGTGLGMSIAKKLTEQMGGSISFCSKQGEGTTFTVKIPFQIDHAQYFQDEKKTQTLTWSIKGRHILLVEDNELNMEIAKFLLEKQGAVVSEAWNGKEALEMFTASEIGGFDAILMDIMMPMMDGHEATREIRKLERADAKSIPIIAMTANAFAEDRVLAKNAGMNEHIAKPLDVKNMIEVVARLIEESK